MSDNDGVYKVTFQAAGRSGVGVIFLTGEKIHGGDGSYFYRGTIQTAGGKFVSAALIVQRYFEGQSIFGPLDNFGLELHGQIEGDSFHLRGHRANRPDLQLSVDGLRIAEGDI